MIDKLKYDFSKKVLKSLGFYVDKNSIVRYNEPLEDSEDDYLCVDLIGDSFPGHGWSVYLPKNNEEKLLQIPFNIMQDKPNQTMIGMIKSLVEKQLDFNILMAGDSILEVLSSSKYNSNLTKGLKKLKEDINNIGPVGNTLDSKSIDAWFEPNFADDYGEIKLITNDDSPHYVYGRLAMYNALFYRALKMNTKDCPEIHGVKLRNKDVAVNKLVFEYMLGEIMDSRGEIGCGTISNDENIVLSIVELYITISEKLNKVVKSVSYVLGKHSVYNLVDFGGIKKSIIKIRKYNQKHGIKIDSLVYRDESELKFGDWR